MFRKIKEFLNDIKEIKSFLTITDSKMDHIINQQRETVNFYDDISDCFDFVKSYTGKRVGVTLNDKYIKFGECINAGIIITNAENFDYDIKNYLIIKDRNGVESTEIMSKDKKIVTIDEVSTPTVSWGEHLSAEGELSYTRAYDHIIKGSDTP